MLNPDANERSSASSLPLLAAADLQDNLMTTAHDLDRLQTLLDDACDTLAQSFHGACEQLTEQRPHVVSGTAPLDALAQKLGGAVTALQFQDMASQLIQHTHQRLRNCSDRIAQETMGDDEDGVGIVADAPLRPNPVTQDEMDAGSVELFQSSRPTRRNPTDNDIPRQLEHLMHSILAVDDSASMRQMVSFTLKSAGYLVVEAVDGQDAWEKAGGRDFDLVLTDQNMPRMDGISLTKKLRGNPKFAATPILILTTESSDQMKQAGRGAGATGWMVKPFDPAKLLEVIKKVIR